MIAVTSIVKRYEKRKVDACWELLMPNTSNFTKWLAASLGCVRSELYNRTYAYFLHYAQAARSRAQIRRRLGRTWVRSRVRRIEPKEAIQLIDARSLKTVNGSWHFSWDIERFFDKMLLYENSSYSYVFHTEPINQWAPAPLFTDDPRVNFLIAHYAKNCPFWLLKLTNFDDFLTRRSKLSTHPDTNFPTWQTYPRFARKLACKLERMPLDGNIDFFCKYHDQWKLPKYGSSLSSKNVLEEYFKNHPRVPKDWLFIHALRENTSNAYKGVCLVIEDGRSCSAYSIASERKHGRFLFVESIKECCNLGYSTFDTGVTGAYGGYKSPIFLDRIETDDTGIPSFLPGPPLSLLFKSEAKRRKFRE